MTIFLGLVATQMWHDYDSNYYERNKNRMFSPRKVSSETLSRWYLKPNITRMVTRLKCIKYDDVLDYSFMMSSELYARVFFDFGDNSTDSNQFDWC